MNGNIECAFVGHLTADPEAKTAQAGSRWAKLRVAVGEGESVQWARVAVFGDAARDAEANLHKGLEQTPTTAADIELAFGPQGLWPAKPLHDASPTLLS